MISRPFPPTPRRCVVVIAGLVALAFTGPAAAQQPAPPPSAAESRATLERACRDDGEDAVTCACMGQIMSERFSGRELAGAALMFSDPTTKTDPAAAIMALIDAGYSLEEITGVAERIAALEDDANATCGAESAARAPDGDD